MDINWNKFNLEIGDKVVLDATFRNRSEVEIVLFSPNKMFARIRSKDGVEWETMTKRLSPIKNK